MHKRINFLINTCYAVVIMALVFLGIYVTSNWLMPFVFAFIVAYLLNPLAGKIADKLNIKKGICAVFLVAIFYISMVIIVFLIGYNVISSLMSMFSNLPSIYTNSILPAIDRIIETFNNTLIRIDPSIEMTVQATTQSLFDNLSGQISAISLEAVSFLTGYATRIPAFFLATLISVVASFFIALDYDNIISYLVKKMNTKTKEIILGVEEYSVVAIKQYIKSYAIIILITFIELAIGLSLFRINNAILIAFLIAIFDIMPILGTGGIIIPWGIINILLGNYPLGIGFLILYAIITVVRQILEPKVVGDKVGLHPVATLISMYVGIQLFGVVGLFLLPVSIVILKQLISSGKLKLFWKE